MMQDLGSEGGHQYWVLILCDEKVQRCWAGSGSVRASGAGHSFFRCRDRGLQSKI